eukprot:scaffold14838_cov45-Attheya_sp.AAC.2
MGIDIYPPIIYERELSTPTFGAEIDDACKAIHDACKGWGTDESGVIEALATRSPDDRYKISLHYKEIYDKELKDLMKKEVGSGDFGMALQFLALPSDVAECAMLKKACDGIGTSERILYPILCGRTNKEMEILKKTYFKTYTKDLGKKLDGELSGNLERFVFNCLQGAEEEYDPQYHTDDKAKEDAEYIYKNGQGKWGTNEKNMFKVLIASPTEHLEAMNRAYADKYGYTLPKALEKELSGTVGNAACFEVGMKLKPYETIAELIKSACKGIGTDELLLTTTLIRYQHVMTKVMMAHIDLYGKSVHERVRSECRGNYRKALLAVLNSVWPEDV